MPVWETTSTGKYIRYFKESFFQSSHCSNLASNNSLCLQEEMEASYNGKIQQSKNSLGW
uniref:Uncharacterized protein n=1 Tax=Helianthus annuus TaxID=4232 RepID=A0A251UAC4_HELAN